MNRAARRQAERQKQQPNKQLHKLADRVVIGYPYPSEVSARFHHSMLNLWRFDMLNQQRIISGGGLFSRSSGANVTNARNEIVENFLDKHDADWLWFVDTDMVFEPDTLERLIAVADPVERPIVGALCFQWINGKEPAPTLYGFDSNNNFVRASSWQHGECLDQFLTGTGCLLIHRSVLVAMREKFSAPYSWFREEAYNGRPVGEDITFGLRAASLGFKTTVDSSIVVGHEKSIVINDDVWFERATFNQIGRSVPTVCVIPVLNNLELTQKVVGQLQAQQQLHTLIVCDNGSTDETVEWCAANGVDVVDCSGASIYSMWNEGIKKGQSIFGDDVWNLLVLNNDIEIGPDFVSGLAGALRSEPRLMAVGPNYDRRVTSESINIVKGISAGREDGTGGLPGFAFMVRGELFSGTLPWFDDRYQLWYGDNDFCISMDLCGGKYGIVRDVKVTHVGGGSKTLSQIDHKKIVEEDRRKFVQKWKASQ